MKDLRTPAEITDFVSDLSVKKATYKPTTTRILASFAGMFIAIGGAASSKINVLMADSPFKSIAAALSFTIGIVLVLIAGGELFTGNILISVGFLDKKINIKQVLTNWLRVWCWNFVGAIFFSLLTYVVIKGNPKDLEFFQNILLKKTSLGFFYAMISGILCNILVCLSVWMSFATSEGPGKFLLSAFPVFIFVLLGYEHVVANMFYITIAYLSGGSVPILTTIVNSFIPVTIGNIIGGCIIASAYKTAYKN